jgi:hypothetical protein
MIVDVGNPLVIDIREHRYSNEDQKSSDLKAPSGNRIYYYDEVCVDASQSYDFRTSRLTNGTEFKEGKIFYIIKQSFEYSYVE